MKYAIEYVKRFTSGTLAGLEVPCRVGFETRDAAARYLSTANLFVGKQGADVLTGSQWIAKSVELVEVSQ